MSGKAILHYQLLKQSDASAVLSLSGPMQAAFTVADHAVLAMRNQAEQNLTYGSVVCQLLSIEIYGS